MSHQQKLLNLLPISMGGGLQNSLSLMEAMADELSPTNRNKWTVVARNSQIAELAQSIGMPVLLSKPDAFSRAKIDLDVSRRFLPNTLCFTLFGPSFVTAGRKFININGCAYSNLFYPEIDFWKHDRHRVWRSTVDHMRRIALRQADHWIFETDLLAFRAIQHFGFPGPRVSVVKMSPSLLVERGRVSESIRRELCNTIGTGFRFLHLCSGSMNKRVHLSAAIAETMIASGAPEFCFVTTMHPNSQAFKLTEYEFKSRGILKCWVNVGPVSPDSVPSLIAECDAMCCFSVLESFSNNFVEAWEMGCPLIVTDADWSRAACENAALYIDPEDPCNAAAIAIRVLRGETDVGTRTPPASLPSARERCRQYLDIVENAHACGKCSYPERSRVFRVQGNEQTPID